MVAKSISGRNVELNRPGVKGGMVSWRPSLSRSDLDKMLHRAIVLVATFLFVAISIPVSHQKETGEEGVGNESRRLRVALHAQVSPSQGFVVGSAITTAGRDQGTFQGLRGG